MNEWEKKIDRENNERYENRKKRPDKKYLKNKGDRERQIERERKGKGSERERKREK